MKKELKLFHYTLVVYSDGSIRNKRKNKCYSLWRDRYGYLVFGLWTDGYKKHLKAHRIVCEAYHGEPIGERVEVNHKNGITDDNRPCNLQWVTPSENMQHSYDTGLRNKTIGG